MAELDDAIAQYRAELLAHCYRMTGALSDAEDALQNALVRAWKAFDAFEGRASLRTWLYKIATNACLDLLATRKARTLPEFVEDDAEPAWLEPFPKPDDALAHREAVRLAFIVVLQELPPKQRATLILRDVVGMSAEETAATLDTSVSAVNSAMQRARAVLDERPRATTKPPVVTAAIRDLLGKYLALWEAGDASGLVALLREDAVLTMPPLAIVARGREAIERVLRDLVFARGPVKLVACEANGAPAFAGYQGGTLVALTVLDFEDDQIATMHSFLGIDGASYGLRAQLPGA